MIRACRAFLRLRQPISVSGRIAVGAAAVSLVGLPFFGMPTAAAWPYVTGSECFLRPRMNERPVLLGQDAVELGT